jgi:hypothetical protein
MLTATIPAHGGAPAPALRPEIAALVDAGMLARAAARDAGWRLGVPLAARGGLTAEQALALAALLGVDAPCPANDA